VSKLGARPVTTVCSPVILFFSQTLIIRILDCFNGMVFVLHSRNFGRFRRVDFLPFRRRISTSCPANMFSVVTTLQSDLCLNALIADLAVFSMCYF
jgi:hypothetical protein